MAFVSSVVKISVSLPLYTFVANENDKLTKLDRIYQSVRSSQASFGTTITALWHGDIVPEESYGRVSKSVIYAVYLTTCIIADIRYLRGSWHSKLLSEINGPVRAFAYRFMPDMIINNQSWNTAERDIYENIQWNSKWNIGWLWTRFEYFLVGLVWFMRSVKQESLCFIVLE